MGQLQELLEYLLKVGANVPWAAELSEFRVCLARSDDVRGERDYKGISKIRAIQSLFYSKHIWTCMRISQSQKSIECVDYPMITPYYPHFISWLAIVCQPGVPSEFPGTDPFGRGDDEQTRGEYQDPAGTGVGLSTGGRLCEKKMAVAMFCRWSHRYLENGLWFISSFNFKSWNCTVSFFGRAVEPPN